MTFNQMLNDLVLFGVFLLAGFFIREIIKPIQKLFIPASVIGGLLALVLGEQCLGLIAVPASFSQYSGALIRVVMAALVFGVSMNMDKAKSYADYMLACHSVYGGQMLIGVALGAVFCVVWPSLPTGWGFQGVQSFYGGHGTAGAAGAVFEELTGGADITGIGMVLSTFGLIVAMVAGMAVVNYGVRHGWTQFVKNPEKQPDSFYGGVLPQESRKAIGSSVTTSISVNAIALQAAWIFLAMFFGETIFKYVALVLPVVTKMPQFTYDVVGALLLWPILRTVGLDRFVDKKTINEISGFCLEALILGSMATLSIKIITTYMVPLVIFTVIMCALTIGWALFFCKAICKDQWFEKAIMICGQSTGATPTGLALVRTVDPDGQACAPDAHGIYSGFTFWTTFFTGMLPVSLVTGNISVAVFWGLLQFGICAVLGFAVFGRAKRRTAKKAHS